MPRLVMQARTGKLRIIGRGENLVDITYIDNCTQAHLSVLKLINAKPEAWGRAYFISDGKPVNLWGMVNKFLEVNGIAPVKKRLSKNIALASARIMEKARRPDYCAEPPRITSFLVHELSSSHWFDISAARNLLGYHPVVSTDEGLRKLAAGSGNEIMAFKEGVVKEENLPDQKIVTLKYFREINRLEGKGLRVKSWSFALFYLGKTSHLLKEGARRVGVEAYQTKQMANIFFRMLETRLDLKNRREPPTEEEVKEAIKQLKDVGRISLFATVSILPGGGFSLIGLELLARRFGIKGFTLVPSSFRKSQGLKQRKK
jgi:hypothetical protein